jgi:hypothetical protein
MLVEDMSTGAPVAIELSQAIEIALDGVKINHESRSIEFMFARSHLSQINEQCQFRFFAVCGTADLFTGSLLKER